MLPVASPSRSWGDSMAINKVVYGGSTLIDLTSNTATAATIESGYTTKGADGNTVTGTMVINHYYTGSSTPSSSVGSNGDLYLVVS